MKLFREIGLLPSTFLVIGNIIGIGIFTTSGLIAEEIGSSLWLLGVWLLGGLLALVGAVCYAALSAERPEAGGEYALLYPYYGPLTAFVAGWASLLIGFSAPIAASALGLAHYLLLLVPLQAAAHPLSTKLTAASVLLLITSLLSFGLKPGNRLHSAVTIFNLVLVLVFAATVLFRSPAEENLQLLLSGNASPFSWPSLGTALIMVMFAYSGWNAAVYLAEEIRSPQRYIPASLVVGTATVILIYLLMNLAYFGAVPASELKGQIAVAEITARAAFGTKGTIVVNVLILFSILSSITAMSIAGPRVYFAMSRHQLFPNWLGQVDVNRKVPLKAIWFQTVVALLLIMVGTFREILIYSGFVLLLFSTLTVSALLVHGAREKQSSLWRIAYRSLAGTFVLVNLLVLVNAAISNRKETLAGAITLALGLPVYFYYQRRRKGCQRLKI